MSLKLSEQAKLVAYALCQALVLVLFYWPFLFGSQVFYFEDITYFFEPLCTFIGRSFANGHIPLWNPYNYCGMPQAAICSPGIFYPPNLLFACLPFSSALASIMILSQTVCGVGGYLLILSLGWGALPAIICGALLALSGYMFSLSANYTLVAAASWVPLSFWSVAKLDSQSEKTAPRWLILTAVCIFMLIAAGRPEISFPALVLLLAFAFYSSWKHENPNA